MSKRGLQGGYMAGCCPGHEVWAIACRAPNINGPHDPNVVGGGNTAIPHLISYDLRNNYSVNTGGLVEVDVHPELWPRVVNTSWPMYLAKLPGTAPSAKLCDPTSAISSHEDGSFSVQIANAAVHAQQDVTDEHFIVNKTYAYSTRAVYVDGKQTWIVARTSPSNPTSEFSGAPAGETVNEDDNTGFPGDRMHWGDHHVVSIGSQEVSGSYRVGTLNGKSPTTNGGLNLSEMEKSFTNTKSLLFNCLTTGDAIADAYDIAQPACNQISMGKEYFVISSYRPGVEGWTVARVKYEGTRLDTETEIWGDGIEVFSTDHSPADLGTTDPEPSYVGDYIIMLPTCRVYIDSTVEGSDECWVVAIRKPSAGGTKLVTGQWLSKVFRTEGSDAEDTELNHFADGTLDETEVANVIVDADDYDHQASEDYPGEEWNNLQVRSYNRVYDPSTGHSKDLILFTTQDVDPNTVAEDIIADFEQPEGYDPDFLSNGLEPAGLTFSSGGNVSGNKWIADDTGAYTGGGSVYSARTNISAVFEGFCDLSITVNVMTSGTLSFLYRLDNRWYGTRIPPFETLTNFPDPDNNLEFRVDGQLVPCTIDSVPFDTSLIDNANVPGAFDEESDYLTWRTVEVTLTPGTHTLTWRLWRRFQDNGHLYAQLDNITFPDLLIGEDSEGAKRWFYNGEKVQSFHWWAWARRDEEATVDISTRVSTKPDFITMDRQGKILIGNPHYTVRLKRQEADPTLFELDQDFGEGRGDGFTEGQGYVRFTASPFTDFGTFVPGCSDPDPELNMIGDGIKDPPWGAFQILPTSDGFQIRGANATVRDATNLPFKEEEFPFKHPLTGEEVNEKFYYYMQVRGEEARWCHRCHSWTISDNGKHLRMHCDVIWNWCRHSPAWPESEWPHPPYRSNFATADHNDEFAPFSVRPRNKLFLTSDSEASRWGEFNYVIPPTFSDTFSQKPYGVWVRALDDPPNDEEDPAYWDPDWAYGVGFGPWPSASWIALHPYFIPTGQWIVFYWPVLAAAETICPDGETAKQSLFFRPRIGMPSQTGMQACFTDFDAVDNSCPCDC